MRGMEFLINVEKEKLTFKQVDADFIVAIETGGMFDRLVENGFDTDSRAILIHLKGQPARSTRRFIKRLNEEKKLPVLVFPIVILGVSEFTEVLHTVRLKPRISLNI